MKRFRVLPFFDFDTRANILEIQIKDEWDSDIKKQHQESKKIVLNGLVNEFGALQQNKKVENFIALDSKPFSILAFHNKFLDQIRNSFIIGSYYPALTGVCALGERILNYLLITLRDDFKGTPEYKIIYQKESFDNWDIPIKTLESWDILLPSVVKNFNDLKEMRNKAIHFRPETDQNTKKLAFTAIKFMNEIIRNQFSSWGNQPWFITKLPGELYIKKAWETKPFIKKIYLPSCALLGYKNRILSILPKVVINDEVDYPDTEISDEKFCELRMEHKKKNN